MAGLVENWSSQGNCARGGTDPDSLFVTGAEQNRAKRICRGCPVVLECLADALDNRTEFGVWGGRTERERRAILRRHPGVTSWRGLFEAAMRQQEAALGQAQPSQLPNVAPALGDSALGAIELPSAPRFDTDQTA